MEKIQVWSLLFQKGGAMIVCSCNIVSDREVHACLETAKARPSVGKVFRQLGCAVQCGRCARNVAAIIDEYDAPAREDAAQDATFDMLEAGELAA